MFKSYISIAIRNILREKWYALLNVAGFATGITCFILISFWIRDELSYDRHFVNYDRIYRVESSLVTEGAPKEMVATDRRLAPLLQQQYRDVCVTAGVYCTPTLLSHRQRTDYEEQSFYVDDTFFEIFSFDFIYGDPKTALRRTNAVVLTEHVALKLFGKKNPLGDTVWIGNKHTKIKNEAYIITGVVKENKRTSHFHPAALLRKTRGMDTFEIVYILLHKNYTPSYFIERIWTPLYDKYFRPNYIDEHQDITLDRLQPLKHIHLANTKWEDFETNGSRTLVYIFTALGALILFTSCVNYVNLSTARSLNRAKEIGIRKVLGAHSRQIILQFITESTITVFAAVLLALSMTEIILPHFNQLSEKDILIDVQNVKAVLVILAFTFFIGIAAGAYPAFFISSFEPTKALKGVQDVPSRKPTVRKTLVVLQFSVSFAMLIATIVVAQQLHFLKTYNLGFDQNRMLLVDLNDEKVNANREAVKQALLQNGNILMVTATDNIPGGEINNTYIDFEAPGGMKAYLINSMFVDQDFVQAMGLKITEGSAFNSAMKARTDSAYIIINESAKRFLNYKFATGKKINTGQTYGYREGRIVGVVKDFHATSLHQQISPLVLALGTLGRPEGKKKYLTIKVLPHHLDSTIAFIGRTYKAFGQGGPFSYAFLDRQFNEQYRLEEKQKTVFNWFAALSIFSSFLGLVGLASFFIRQRSKEIAIRRISGASVYGIVTLLASDFVQLTIISWAIAAPVAYIVMSRWLALFAYHINVRPTVIFFSGIAGLLFVVITIAIQAIVATRKHPASALRYE